MPDGRLSERLLLERSSQKRVPQWRKMREFNAMFNPDPKVITKHFQALPELQEARSRNNGLANSPQDKPQDKGSEPGTYPDSNFGMKSSERNNGKHPKDRNHWDHPSARDPP